MRKEMRGAKSASLERQAGRFTAFSKAQRPWTDFLLNEPLPNKEGY
jgi:hypothetical protein